MSLHFTGMADIVTLCLDEFAIMSRLGCLTMDNASNNDTLIASLDETFVRTGVRYDWNPNHSRIRCLPHIINLAVMAFLRFLGNDGMDPDVYCILESSPFNLLKR